MVVFYITYPYVRYMQKSKPWTNYRKILFSMGLKMNLK